MAKAKTNRAMTDAEPQAGVSGGRAFDDTPTPPFNIAQQIALQLAREILAGDIPEGSKLSEEQLAKRFGVSRGPIRDAIGILERNVFVRWPPRRSALVNSTSRNEIEQLFHVRANVLGLTAWYAAKNAEPAEVEKLRHAIDVLEQQNKRHPGDVEGFYTCNHAVWRILTKSAHARTIEHIVLMIAGSPIWQLAVRDKIRGSATAFSGMPIVTAWHTVADAMSRRDAETARTAAESILMTTWSFIAETFPTDNDQSD